MAFPPTRLVLVNAAAAVASTWAPQYQEALLCAAWLGGIPLLAQALLKGGLGDSERAAAGREGVQGQRASGFHWFSVLCLLLTAAGFGARLLTSLLTHSSGPPSHTIAFLASECAIWLALALCYDWPRRRRGVPRAYEYSWVQRQWLLLSFLLTTFVAGCGLIARDTGAPLTGAMVSALATWPTSLLLLDAAIRGHVSLAPPPEAPLPAPLPGNGRTQGTPGGLSEPLLASEAQLESAESGAPGVRQARGVEGEGEGEAEVEARAPLPAVVDVSREGILSQMMFLWLNPILARGNLKHLTLQDCPPLAHPDLARTNYDRLLVQLEKAQPKGHRKSHANRGAHQGPQQPGESAPGTPLVGSVVWLIWSTYWVEIASMGVMALCCTVLQYTGPVMLNLLVQHTQAQGAAGSVWVGLGLAVLLLGLKFGENATSRCWYFSIQRTAMRIRAALVGALFQKALRLSNKARAKHGTGELTNYLQVDVQRIADFMWWCHDCWVLPMEACFALGILANTVGLGAAGGFAAMILCVAVQVPVAQRQRKYQENVMKCKDKRMKATTEVLRAMRAIKFWCWERHFCKHLESLRQEEYGWVKANQFTISLNITMIWLCPLLAAAFTLGLCVLLGRPLSSAQVFTAMATFRIIQIPIFLLPQLISEISMAAVSVRRLHDLLNEEELQHDAVHRGGSPGAPHPATPGVPGGPSSKGGEPQVVVSVVGGVFDWPEPEKKEEDAAEGSSPDKVPGGSNKPQRGPDKGHGTQNGSSSPAGGALPLLAQESTENGAPPTTAAAAAAVLPGGGEVTPAQGTGGQNGLGGAREGGEGTWRLSGVNLEVRAGQKVAVCGKVGGGKSSLLSCILGEMRRVEGEVRVWGSTAYVAQSAWVQTGTIQANILFGMPLDAPRYARVLEACGLDPDLKQLPKGDQTEIGERGITLSGGQKQRIQLARAVYQDKDIYILDDPFSAVDAHTGTHLFSECVLGLLSSKTVILVTHQLEFLPAMDYILVLSGGTIVGSGTHDELRAGGTEGGLLELLDAHEGAMGAVVAEQESAASDMKASDKKAFDLNALGGSAVAVGGGGGEEVPVTGDEEVCPPRRRSLDEKRPLLPGSMPREEAANTTPTPTAGAGGAAVGAGGGVGDGESEEERERGGVGVRVYAAYLGKVRRGAFIPVVVIAQCLFQVAQVSGNFWLSYATTEGNAVSPKKMVEVYSVLSLGGIVFVIVRAVLTAWIGVVASQAFFLDMLRCILRAPMAYFDTTPSGRILARFSSDQSALDGDLPFNFSGFLNAVTGQLSILFVTSTVTPEVLLISIPLGLVFYHIQRYYLASSRELTRITSTSKAPIINSFSESVAGAATIRAFGQEAQSLGVALERVDVNDRPLVYQFAALEWFMFRLEFLSSLVLFSCAVLLVLLPRDIITPALVGLSLSYALLLNQSLSFLAWNASNLENKIVSVERCQQYSAIPPEAPLVIDSCRPPPAWPTRGTLQFCDLEVRYRPSTPAILKGVSFTVEGGHKIGVVGRTGSGKSTLVAALFRLVEASSGRIVIDGVDIGALGLQDLRTRLSIIPQDPTLFEGTVRSNIDPLGEYSDSDVWEALETCQLKDSVSAAPGGLDSSVTEGGENWSVGQRQLLCLGRALLKRSRVLVLDEATASVDAVSDAIIQATIRDTFASCTVLSVAHRIPTVMDSDKVLVLESGMVKEYASPEALLRRRSSIFAQLVDEYAKRSTSMADLASLVRNQSKGDLSRVEH